MFLSVEKHNPSSIAVIDDSNTILTYSELISFADKFYSQINKRTLIFILSENCVEALAGFFGALSYQIVPLLLAGSIERSLLENLIILYSPEFIWCPNSKSSEFRYKTVFRFKNYSLLFTGLEAPRLYEELSFLLPTSGSTGSPKLVRHSYRNIEDNSQNVATLFDLDAEERPIAFLPIHYTMGLSVITSHLYAGSGILLMKSSLTDKNFWYFIKAHGATSFTGVPYSYEILYKLRFTKMDIPSLSLLSQGGGKLNEKLFRHFSDYASETGKRFIATYGQTEGTARMAYLPSEMARKKICSIGKAIPNGKLSLIDDEGNIIRKRQATGQLVFSGTNVTLGYATSPRDLALEDVNRGTVLTGDIARRDSEGYYYIIGRLKRFVKIYGLRISLDELETMIDTEFDTEVICTGDDEKIIVNTTNRDENGKIIDFLVKKTGLFHRAIKMIVVDELPKSEAGKKIYTIG